MFSYYNIILNKFSFYLFYYPSNFLLLCLIFLIWILFGGKRVEFSELRFHSFYYHTILYLWPREEPPSQNIKGQLFVSVQSRRCTYTMNHSCKEKQQSIRSLWFLTKVYSIFLKCPLLSPNPQIIFTYS